MTGIDLAALAPDTEVSSLSTEQSRTQLTRFDGATAAEAFAEFARRGMREFILLGSGEAIADEMIGLAERTGLDGFNITPFVSPGSYRDVVDHVVPVLRERGAISRVPANGTLRERLFGSSRLPARHPAAAARRIPSFTPSATDQERA